MSPKIVDLEAHDIRFPTSKTLDGSDAMNPDPDYSAAYVVVRTDAGDGLEGHGLTFTIGRGTEVVVAGVNALRPLVLGRDTETRFADMGAFWRRLAGDMKPPLLAEMARTIPFAELPGAFRAYIDGKVTGRTVVKIGSQP